ncbi:glycosyltransferase family 2 protein [Desulfosporosinus sp. FKA]|uniref:glycosyltransferase n=1 Tax=Desulfosporosinus sp. FKA TaxID=1969834 RepID=UPI000B4A39CD|nr:glycosyltransferase family 2 protein [Desulfosporosinus sp. FKA]
MLSIIIPTYNEMNNVNKTAAYITRLSCLEPYEIIFVDDSNDDTPLLLENLAQTDHHVRFLHRNNEKGLATAVITGFELAQGDILAVMDGDLQHPPELLPLMLQAIEDGADIVIPSRFLPSGNNGVNFGRRIISAAARSIGRLSLKALRHINDPTSGFFMFRKPIIKDIILRPLGWKILIEILVRANYKNVTEIPYKFKPRDSGTSKMSIAEQWNYLRHLMRLIIESPQDRRFYLFSLVGLIGVIVNLLFYVLLVKEMNLAPHRAALISATLAMLSNYGLNKLLTWSDIKNGHLLSEFFKYVIASCIGISVNICLLYLLYYRLRCNYLFANVGGIFVGAIWNYIINNHWTFAGKIATSVSRSRIKKMHVNF